jgi:hypothetical protein
MFKKIWNGFTSWLSYVRDDYFGLLLLAIIIVASLAGCNKSENATKTEIQKKPEVVTVVVVVEGCEYVLYQQKDSYAGMGGLTHKGNCKFCEEKAEKNKR